MAENKQDAELPESKQPVINSDQNDDKELDDLLDSALEDFDKPSVIQPTATSVEKQETAAIGNSKSDKLWSDEFLQQNPLFDAVLNQDQPKSAEEFEKFAAMLNKTGDGDDADLNLLTQDFLSNLSASAQAFSDQHSQPLNDEDLSRMFSSLGLNIPDSEDAASDMPSVVQNMMQMLLSKDLLYPSLRDITDRYPNWLEENKPTLDKEQYDKYSTQCELMKKICQEFEAEADSDSADTKKSRFELILDLMQKMQDCGNPPTSLIGDGAGAFEFDENGLPKIPGLPSMGNEKCHIM